MHTYPVGAEFNLKSADAFPKNGYTQKPPRSLTDDHEIQPANGLFHPLQTAKENSF